MFVVLLQNEFANEPFECFGPFESEEAAKKFAEPFQLRMIAYAMKMSEVPGVFQKSEIAGLETALPQRTNPCDGLKRWN